FVANPVLKLMVRKDLNPVGARVLVLGLAFKENCPDLRNTRVVDIVQTLQGYNARVDVFDPWVDADEARHEYGINLVSAPEARTYDAVILAVAHHQFAEVGQGARDYIKPGGVLYDVKGVLPRDDVDGRL